MDLTANMHQILCSLRKCATEMLAMIIQGFRKEGMSSTWVFERKSPNTETGKGETGKEQSQEYASPFL
jgi:hypothetical protein